MWSDERRNHSDSGADATPLRCYESVRGSCLRPFRPAAVLALMYAAAATSTLMTVFGNLLVILSISYFRQLRSPTNLLLRSLAVCDLLLGLLVMPTSAVRSTHGCWYLGNQLCQLHTSIDIMLCTASIFHLCSIAIDRYLAICWPMLYPSLITPTTLATLVAASWLVPAVFAFGLIFSGLNMKGSEEFFHDYVSCVGGCPVFLTHTASVVATWFCFFLPALVMVCVYAKIYSVARVQARAIRDQVLVRSRPGQLRKPERCGKESRGAAILAVVMGVFLLCWCPFFLCIHLDPFLNYSIPPVLMDVLTWLGYLNSTLNPIVYALLYTWFRRALRVIISGEVFHRGSQRLQLICD